MTKKPNITVKELAAVLTSRTCTGCRLEYERMYEAYLPLAHKMLAALDGDGLTPRQRAADELYGALRCETDILEYLDNPAAQVGRDALAQADGKVG